MQRELSMWRRKVIRQRKANVWRLTRDHTSITVNLGFTILRTSFAWKWMKYQNYRTISTCFTWIGFNFKARFSNRRRTKRLRKSWRRIVSSRKLKNRPRFWRIKGRRGLQNNWGWTRTMSKERWRPQNFWERKATYQIKQNKWRPRQLSQPEWHVIAPLHQRQTSADQDKSKNNPKWKAE